MGLASKMDDHRDRNDISLSKKRNMKLLMVMWQMGNTYGEDNSNIEKEMKEIDPEGEIMLEIINDRLDELYDAQNFYVTKEIKQKALDSLDGELEIPQ